MNFCSGDCDSSFSFPVLLKIIIDMKKETQIVMKILQLHFAFAVFHRPFVMINSESGKKYYLCFDESSIFFFFFHSRLENCKCILVRKGGKKKSKTKLESHHNYKYISQSSGKTFMFNVQKYIGWIDERIKENNNIKFNHRSFQVNLLIALFNMHSNEWKAKKNIISRH